MADAAPTLKLLLLEDSPSDAALVVAEIRRAGYRVDWTRVDTPRDFAARLGPDLDLIVADYSLPQFGAPEALEILGDAGIDVPFIVVTGTVSEEHVVECMRNGAADYLLKDRLGRLGSAVARAIAARADRRDRARALAALRESEERFRSLVETAGSIVLYLSADGRVIEFNPEAERAFGVNRRDAIGRSFIRDLVPDSGRAEASALLRKVLAGRKLDGYEYALETPDGGERTVLWNVTRELDADGQPVGIVAVGQDITERKHLEQQLRQSQKMEAVGRLAGGVAHDFNNLLTVIRGYTDLALRKLGEGHPLLQSLEEIRNAADRAGSLTKQLLAFSRKQVLQPKVVDLNRTLDDLARMMTRLIGEDVMLDLRLDPNLSTVLVDPGQMEQVIINLIVNARDAMPSGGRIRVETSMRTVMPDHEPIDGLVAPGDYVVLSVADNGCGMDRETVARIFEPFFTTKGPEKGTGLGLSTVYGIVSQSGGAIHVESELDRGTTFEIYLPVGSSATAGGSGAASDLVDAAGGETVLVVEDEDAVRRLVQLALQLGGYSVVAARSGEEAISQLAERGGSIDLVLTDVIMPGMNGRALLDRVRSEWPEMPVLLMSGYTDRLVDTVDMATLGSDILFKPFTPDALARAVRTALERSGARTAR